MRTGQIAAYIFRIRGGDYEFLMFKRRKDKGGFWHPMTGGLEGNEVADSALLRELAEETGFVPIRVVPLDYVFSFEGAEGYTLAERSFGVEVADDAVLQLNNENTAAKWLDANAFHARLRWPENQAAFDELLDKLGHTPLGEAR